MNKTRYHVTQSDEGWEVEDANGIFINPEPFKSRHEAVRFLRDCEQSSAEARANDRYWARLESQYEERYDLGD